MKRLARMGCIAMVAVLAACSRQDRVERHLARADACYGRGEYEESIIEYRNVLQLDPGNNHATARIGGAWLSRGARVRALPYIARARQNDPRDFEAQRQYLDLAVALGKLAEARTGALELLERNPDDGVALLALARASRTREDLAVVEKALHRVHRPTVGYHLASAVWMQRTDNAAGERRSLDRALAVDPRSPAAHTLQASMHLAKGAAAEALAEFRAAAEGAGPRSDEAVAYAQHLAAQGDISGASEYLTKVSHEAPDYLPVWCALAELAAHERRWGDALAHLDQAYRWDPANYECELVRARILRGRGDIKGALAVLESLAQRFPGTSADKYELGLAHLADRNSPAALDAWRRAVVQNPDFDEAVLALAQLELRCGNAEAAAARSLNLLTVRPHLVAAQTLLLDALRALGRLELVVPSLRQRAEESPDRVELQRLLGLLLKYQRNYAEARRHLERSLELSPGFVPVVAELVDIDLAEGRLGSAERRVEDQRALTPGAPAVFVLAARIGAAQGSVDAVVAGLSGALQSDPAHAPAYDLLRRLAADRREFGARVLEAFLARRPSDFTAFALAGQVYAHGGRYDRARWAYEHALELKPDSTLVLNNLASLCGERLQDLALALELARRARQLDPASPEIADTLGLVLLRQRDPGAALELVKESAARRPANPEIQYHLGLCWQALGDKPQARAAFRTAVTLPGDFPEKSDARARLADLGGPPPGAVVSTATAD